MNDPQERGRAGRRLPQNLEVEARLLGGLMLDGSLMTEVAALLEPADFYGVEAQVVYGGLRRLHDAGKPVDGLSLSVELKRTGELAQVGGDLGISRFLEAAPHAADVLHDAAIVAQKAALRRLITAAAETLDDCYAEELTADEAIARAESRILAVGARTAGADALPIGPLVTQAMDRLGRRRANEYGGLESGLHDLDEMTDGFGPGALVILAARPSMGKTALATQVCDHVAVASAVPTLFVSLEMSPIDLAERILISRARVSGHSVRAGACSAREMQALGEAYGVLRSSEGLWIDGEPIRNIAQIASFARRFKHRRGLGMLVIDYLQLIEPGTESASRASRQEQVSAISRRLKALAKELDVPVLALSQLNRRNEAREDRRPMLSDLRDSGAIEQDADLVLLLHRPEFYDPNDLPGVAELNVAKNRNGQTGTIRLTFLKSSARFEDFHPDPIPVDTGDEPAF